MKWVVKYAKLKDKERWFNFASELKSDFCGKDLAQDNDYCSVMIKNIKRGTAIYIEDISKHNIPIIGAMTFSTNSNHISWLGVHPNYRRKGIATSLFEYMLKHMADVEEIRVKTFLYDDEYGKAARSFYKSKGFVGDEIEMDNQNFPHPVQEFIKVMKKDKN